MEDQWNGSEHGIPRIAFADATPDGIAGMIRRRGCVVVESVVPERSMPGLDARLRDLVAEGSLGDNDFDGYATRRVYDPLARSRVLDDLVLHPLVGAAVELLIGPAQLGMTVLSASAQARSHNDCTATPPSTPYPPILGP